MDNWSLQLQQELDTGWKELQLSGYLESVGHTGAWYCNGVICSIVFKAIEDANLPWGTVTFSVVLVCVLAAGSAREALQANRQTEEPAAPNATTTLPAQFKQRTPMYNSNSNPPATTPTSPLTPTTPPVISPAAQAPQAAPQTQQQPPPKKSLSLTVSKTRFFFHSATERIKMSVFTADLIYYPSSSWPLSHRMAEVDRIFS